MKSLDSFSWEETIKKITYVVGLSSLVIILTLLTWATNKTFDFTDESFYSVGYYFNIDLDNTVIFFHRIYNLFLGFLNLTLGQNRLIALTLSLICSLTLAYNSNLYFQLKNKLLLVITIATIGFLGYFLYPMSLSYNSIAALLIMLIISAVFNYLHHKKKSTLLIIGFLATLILLNKFTNILFLFFLLINLLLLSDKKLKFSSKEFFLGLALISIGVLLTLVLFFPSFDLIKNAINGFFYGLSLSTNHALGDMISRFYNELLRVLSFTIYLIPLIVALIALKRIKIPFFEKNQTLLITVTIITTLLLLEYSTYSFTGTYNVSVFYFLILFISFFSLIFYNKKINEKKQLTYGLLFIITPFIISLGTNNSLFIHFTFNGGIFGLGLFLIINNIPNNIIKYTLFIFTFTTTSFIICYNKFYHPYRSEALNLQTKEIIDIPYLKGIKTTPEVLKTVNKLKEFRSHPAEKVFLCSHQLGVSIVLDKEPLFFSWVDESSYHLISDYLDNKKEELDQNILFFIPSEKYKKETIIFELTTSEKLDFLNSYRYLKSITINNDLLDIYEKK